MCMFLLQENVWSDLAYSWPIHIFHLIAFADKHIDVYKHWVKKSVMNKDNLKKKCLAFTLYFLSVVWFYIARMSMLIGSIHMLIYLPRGPIFE